MLQKWHQQYFKNIEKSSLANLKNIAKMLLAIFKKCCKKVIETLKKIVISFHSMTISRFATYIRMLQNIFGNILWTLQKDFCCCSVRPIKSFDLFNASEDEYISIIIQYRLLNPNNTTL